MPPFNPRLFVLLAALLSPLLAAAAEPTLEPAEPAEVKPQRLGLFVAAGYNGSPGTHGAALTTGLRLAMGRHVALSFDLGYGLIGTSDGSREPGSFQDRWWLMPAVVLVVPVGRVRFDIGAGLGLGTTSGYSDWADFAEAPFMPSWAFQLTPAARVHAVASIALRRNLEAFVRVEAASLLLEGNPIGWRDGNPKPGVRDTTWVNLSLGLQFGLL